MLDGFMELVHESGVIAGDTTDDSYRGMGIAIREFSMGDSSSRDDEDKDAASKDALKSKPTTGLASRGTSAAPAKPKLGLPTDPSKTPETQKKKKERLSFRISKEVDSSSPTLFLAYCKMKALNVRKPEDQKLDEFKEATITLRKMFGEFPSPYLRFKFTGVRLASYKLSISSGDDPIPDESLEFEFDSYSVHYTPQKKDGGRGVTMIKTWHNPRSKS